MSAGTLGWRIAGALGRSGRTVRLYDTDLDRLDAGARGIREEFGVEAAISRGLDGRLADCALVVELVPEIADLKMKVLAEIEELAGVQTVIGGTNSSSYSSSAFSHALKDPTRFLNIHFFWRQP